MNQVTEVPEVWYKKWGKYLLMALLAILTLGAYAYSARSKSPTDTTDKIDDIDQEIIKDKIDDSNVLDAGIDQAQVDAEKIASNGQAQYDQIGHDAAVQTDSEKISTFNDAMKKKKGN